jgi:DNA-binding GntR family transcriptional regulator
MADAKNSFAHTRRAYEAIRRLLFHNEIVPGQKISYRQLAEKLGMSQTPVIQALKLLEVQQLVRHEPKRGCYTAPISMQEVGEIYDFREMIEKELLTITFQKLDNIGLQRLRASLEAYLKAAEDGYLYDRLEKDMDYHLTLASLSGNLIQQYTLKNLFDLLYLKYGGKFLFTSPLEFSRADHQALFDHIEQRDLEGAKQVLSAHIQRVKAHVLHNVERVLAATRM